MVVKKQNRLNKIRKGVVSDKEGKSLPEKLKGWDFVKEKLSSYFAAAKNIIWGLHVGNMPEIPGYISDYVSQIRKNIFDYPSGNRDKEDGKFKNNNAKQNSKNDDKNNKQLKQIVHNRNVIKDENSLPSIDFNAKNVKVELISPKTFDDEENNLKVQKQGNKQVSGNSFIQNLKSYFDENLISPKNIFHKSIENVNMILNSFIKNKNENGLQFDNIKNIVSEKNVSDINFLNNLNHSEIKKDTKNQKLKWSDYSKLIPYIIGNFLDVPIPAVNKFSSIEKPQYMDYLAKVHQKALSHNTVYKIQNNVINDINDIIEFRTETSNSGTEQVQSFTGNSLNTNMQNTLFSEKTINRFSDMEQMEEILRCTLDDFIIRMGFDMHNYN